MISLDFERKTEPDMIQAADEFLAIQKRRRSVRHYSSEKVPLSVIRKCIETAAQAPSGANKQPWNEQHVIKWIQQYLNCYTTWRTLYDKQPGACYIVDYKQLIHNRDVVLSSIQSKFRLERKHSDFVDENKTVNASTDHGLIIDRDTQFNIDYYTEQRYMQDIPGDIKDLLFEKLESSPVISRC